MSRERASVILLGGGLGMRLRSLHPDLPKPMIRAAGRPFLEWVIRYFEHEGLRSFVVSLGHRADVALAYLRERPADGARIAAVVEPAPLGTGGALAFAAQAAPGADPLVAANADSLFLADLGPAWAASEPDEVDGVVLGAAVSDAARYGTLEVDAGGRLTAFREKVTGRGIVNAGIYVLRRRLLERFPARRPLSLEREALPALLAEGAHLRVVACDAPFLDIGTPESLAQAEPFIARHFHVGGTP
jgi:D-glycero-alpha-D-manno-heptose 1-phosphate guanylyltransferase